MALTSMCKYCQQPIRWALTSRGKRAPFDASPDPKGNHIIRGHEAIRLVGVELEAAHIQKQPLFTHHAAGCHARRPRTTGGMPPHVREQLSRTLNNRSEEKR